MEAPFPPQRIIKDSKRRCHRFETEPPAVFKEFCLFSKERNILVFTDYSGPAWACFLAKTLLKGVGGSKRCGGKAHKQGQQFRPSRPFREQAAPAPSLQHTHIQLTQLAHTSTPPRSAYTHSPDLCILTSVPRSSSPDAPQQLCFLLLLEMWP